MLSEIQKLSFVIPCYGSENTINSVVDEIDLLMKDKLNNYEYEIIFINDCSPDNVWTVIKNIIHSRNNCKGISFAKNFGQHSALMAGYRAASGDIIITLDDDGQTPIDQTYLLVDKIIEGFDVVYAKYREIKQPFWRKIGSKINDKMSVVLIGKPKKIDSNSFYAMRSFIAKEMIKYENSYPYIGGLIFRSTKLIGNVIVDHRERLMGRSGYTLGKLIKLWMNGFTAFSVVPLRFSSLMGVVCAFFGFVFGLYTIVRKLILPNISVGWSSIVALILFIGGLIMLMLGMIGEYLGRIYISINNSPQYVIKETINIENE